MNEYEVFITMLKRAEISFDVKAQLSNRTIKVTIGTGAAEGSNNHGYTGFEAEFIFADGGNLLRTGVWE